MATIEFEELGENKKSLNVTKEAAANLTRPESQFMFHRLVEKGYSGIFMDYRSCIKIKTNVEAERI